MQHSVDTCRMTTLTPFALRVHCPFIEQAAHWFGVEAYSR